jgi:tRNA threonylcarbamoyladenosine biosynthesis protein TsaB
MILLLDTSTPICKITLLSSNGSYTNQWQADRELAKHLLKYITDQLQKNNVAWSDLSGIGVFRGPGSFTGLRIGITVLNTASDALGIPIVGEVGEDWQESAKTRLQNNENDRIVLPFYGSEAHITKPRK